MGDDLIVESYDSPLPRNVIREGLCDGRHWAFVHQEGTFFRRWLWDAAAPGKTLAAFRQAGDWALWQRFARHASLVQSSAALGATSFRAGRNPARRPEQYLAEIERAIPEPDRAAALGRLARTQNVRRRTIQSTSHSTTLRLYEESVHRHIVERHTNRFGYPPAGTMPEETRTCVSVGANLRGENPTSGGRESTANRDDRTPILEMPGIVGIDAAWQFPAITEQHAFRCLAAIGNDLPQSPLYVAFPWAPLIDQLQTGSASVESLMEDFHRLCRRLPKDRPKVTVCQHILARKYRYLFDKAGIADVFWSHATASDTAAKTSPSSGICFHPFPLYPVQAPEAMPEAAHEADRNRRPYL